MTHDAKSLEGRIEEYLAQRQYYNAIPMIDDLIERVRALEGKLGKYETLIKVGALIDGLNSDRTPIIRASEAAMGRFNVRKNRREATQKIIHEGVIEFLCEVGNAEAKELCLKHFPDTLSRLSEKPKGE